MICRIAAWFQLSQIVLDDNISCLGSRFHAWNWWFFLLYNNISIYQVLCTLCLNSSYLSTPAVIPNNNELLERQKWIYTHCIWSGLDRVLGSRFHSVVTLLEHKLSNLMISQGSVVRTVLHVNIPWFMCNNTSIKRMLCGRVYFK